MKYNTLLVPVVALATLVTALPSDASNHHGYPSDQGKYKPQRDQQQLKQEGPSFKVPSLPPSAPSEIAESLPFKLKATDALPVKPEAAFARIPVKPEAAFARIPVRPDMKNGLPVKGTSSLPVDAADATEPIPFKSLPTPSSMPVPDPSLPTPGFLPKLPADLPPKELPKVPGMRRFRQHATRASNDEVECGRLVVLASDNKFSGFVSAVRDEDGRHTVVKDRSQAAVVDLKAHNLVPRGIDTYAALGATFGVMQDKSASEDNMQGNSANFAMLTGTSMTMYGKADTLGESSFNDATGATQKVESAIYYSGENNEVLASWINKDGKGIPVQWGVNPDSQLIVSANIGQYNGFYGGKSARVFCSEQ